METYWIVTKTNAFSEVYEVLPETIFASDSDFFLIIPVNFM